MDSARCIRYAWEICSSRGIDPVVGDHGGRDMWQIRNAVLDIVDQREWECVAEFRTNRWVNRGLIKFSNGDSHADDLAEFEYRRRELVEFLQPSSIKNASSCLANLGCGETGKWYADYVVPIRTTIVEIFGCLQFLISNGRYFPARKIR